MTFEQEQEQQFVGREHRIRTDDEIGEALQRFCDVAWVGKAIFSIPVNERADADIILADAWAELKALRAAHQAAEAEATRLRQAARTLPDYDVRCNQCGAPHWIDTVLPSEVWSQIATPDDLLCMLCIDERLAAAGLTAEAGFYFVGQALKSRLYEESHGTIAYLEGEATRLRAAVGRLAEALIRGRDLLQAMFSYAILRPPVLGVLYPLGADEEVRNAVPKFMWDTNDLVKDPDATDALAELTALREFASAAYEAVSDWAGYTQLEGEEIARYGHMEHMREAQHRLRDAADAYDQAKAALHALKQQEGA